MRSSVPMPRNPWPHDMLITVESGEPAAQVARDLGMFRATF